MHETRCVEKYESRAAALEHILVVDDELIVRETLAALLTSIGYRATSASSAQEALLCLQQNPFFDLVLSDLCMPNGDGFSLLHSISRTYVGLPVVMVTSTCDVHTATEAFRAGATDFLLKPFALSQLTAVVQRALHHGRVFKQNAAYRQSLEEAVMSRTTRLNATMVDLEKSYDITLEVLGDALDLRDTETEGHARRVTTYSVALAREMRVEAAELRTIARGAFLHDVGKIATPDSILLKPSALDPEEVQIMRRHSACGYEMVRKVPFLRDVSDIVYAHHEAFDGSGYPRRLRGEEIPLGARIFAIADTLDAITSDRPYRPRRSFSEARAEIMRCSGSQFDPHIVDTFLQIAEHVWTALRHEVKRSTSGYFGLPVELGSSLCRPEVAPALYTA